MTTIDKQFIAELYGREFCMMADISSLSGWRLMERVNGHWQRLAKLDKHYQAAYAAARKLMP